MIEELAPFGTPATTVTGSVYEDELPLLEFYTEECQGFRATLEKNDCKRHLVAVWREAEHIPACYSKQPISSAASLHSAT
jgi:hypothetical protein